MWIICWWIAVDPWSAYLFYFCARLYFQQDYKAGLPRSVNEDFAFYSFLKDEVKLSGCFPHPLLQRPSNGGAEDSASINHPVNGARVGMFTCVCKKMLMMEVGGGVNGGNGRTAKWKSCKMSNACVRARLFHFHYCFRLFPLTVCLSHSHFAIITFINYESGAPDEQGEARCRRRSSQAALRPCALSLREAAHFYFSFINSGLFTGTAKEWSGRTEGGSCCGDREIRSGVFYNYPTLLVMMIILLRGRFICPLALPTASLQNAEWWLHKKTTFYRLSAWLACDMHFPLSTGVFLTRSSAK